MAPAEISVKTTVDLRFAACGQVLHPGDTLIIKLTEHVEEGQIESIGSRLKEILEPRDVAVLLVDGGIEIAVLRGSEAKVGRSNE